MKNMDDDRTGNCQAPPATQVGYSRFVQLITDLE
jgi:hypothetical protein